MATRRRKQKRDLTAKESLEIINSSYGPEEDLFNVKNHRKHELKENTFRFTVDLLSLDFLISLMENQQVKNVYFNPSIPPPGGSVDSISLRYKIYVVYYKL